MIFRKQIQKLKTYFSRDSKTILKKEGHFPCIYSFSLDKSFQLKPDLLRKAVLESPWSLDAPKIHLKNGEVFVDVLVLSNEKGSMLEAQVRSLADSEEPPDSN